MSNLLRVLFGGVLGFGVAKLIEVNKGKSKANCDYTIYVRSNDFDKSYLVFDNYAEAEKVYDKIVSSKTISYKDIVKYDVDEAIYYEENKGRKGYPKLSDKSIVGDVIFSDQNGQIKSKKFRN